MTRSRALILAIATAALAGHAALHAPGAPTAPRPPAAAAPEKEAAAGLTDADYERHVAALRKRLPHAGFTIVVEKPFVVIGDESPRTVRLRAERTVRWAATRLRRGFFARDPRGIIDVWLFKDAKSYRGNAASLFGSVPTSPYGYFSPADRALVMNIATGGGTLVHEMVHAYVESNVPGCPTWLNEGLGSLFEQCADRGGEIVGLTNWRLRGLKEAIRRKALPTFEELCRMSASEFYGGGRGDNYAQARYLLYHLQEKGDLRAYVRDFLAARKADPTGYATLVKTLDAKDMKAFQKRWEAWVLTLTFP